MNPSTEAAIRDTKEFRKQLDDTLQKLKAATGNPPTCPNCNKSDKVEPTRTPIMIDEGKFFCPCNEAGPRCFTPRNSRERALAITKIQEGVMWLGMDLKAINEEEPGSAPNPYPQSYNPQSLQIEPTSGNLKL